MSYCKSLLLLLGAVALASCLDSVNENLWKEQDGLQDVADAGTVDIGVDGLLPDTSVPDGPVPVPDGPVPDTWTPVPDGPVPDTWTPVPDGPLPDTWTPVPDGPVPDTWTPVPDGPLPDTWTPVPDGPVPDTWTPVPDTWTPVPDTWTPQQDGSGTLTPSTSPIVAASTSGYGVVWVDSQSGTPALMFRTLNGSGTPLTAPQTIVTSPVLALTSMTWSGTDYRLLYIDASGIYRGTISTSGTFVSGKLLGPAGAKWAQIVKAGTTYGLAYSTATQVLLQMLDQNSNKKGSPVVVYTAPSTGFTGIGSFRSPMLAYGDGHHGLAFAVESGPGQGAQGPLYFARVTAAGALVGSPQQIQAGPVLYPSVGHGSGQFTVTWHASGGPAVARVNATTGAVTASSLLGGDSCCFHTPMVPAGSMGLVEVWTAYAGSNGLGVVGLDPANSTKLLGPLVALSRAGLTHPWVAALGNELGVVWADTSLGVSEVFFSRLTSSGTPVGSPLQVSPY